MSIIIINIINICDIYGPIILFIFVIIYGFYRIISVNFYLYLQYFKKKFNFSKINRSQTDKSMIV